MSDDAEARKDKVEDDNGKDIVMTRNVSEEEAGNENKANELETLKKVAKEIHEMIKHRDEDGKASSKIADILSEERLTLDYVIENYIGNDLDALVSEDSWNVPQLDLHVKVAFKSAIKQKQKAANVNGMCYFVFYIFCFFEVLLVVEVFCSFSLILRVNVWFLNCSLTKKSNLFYLFVCVCFV